jgi:hypothetical protein
MDRHDGIVDDENLDIVREKARHGPGREVSHTGTERKVIFASDEWSQCWDHFWDQSTPKQRHMEQNK